MEAREKRKEISSPRRFAMLSSMKGIQHFSARARLKGCEREPWKSQDGCITIPQRSVPETETPTQGRPHTVLNASGQPWHRGDLVNCLLHVGWASLLAGRFLGWYRRKRIKQRCLVHILVCWDEAAPDGNTNEQWYVGRTALRAASADDHIQLAVPSEYIKRSQSNSLIHLGLRPPREVATTLGGTAASSSSQRSPFNLVRLWNVGSDPSGSWCSRQVSLFLLPHTTLTLHKCFLLPKHH